VGRSPTIHVTPEDRSRFGSFLSWALTLSGKDVKWLEDEWHKGAETKHERRRTDIADYLEGKRIPDLFNLDRLGALLSVPPGALYLAAGYFELMLGCLSVAAEHLESGAWNHDESPRMAALSRLLSLFPDDDMDAALDQNASLYYIFEKMGRLNIGGERSDDPLGLWRTGLRYHASIRRSHPVVGRYGRCLRGSGRAWGN